VIGVGVIGYGYWGPNLARCLTEAAGCRLVAIADMSWDAIARATRRHPDVEMTTDPTALIDDPRVDAVVIATPVRTHFALAQQALRQGKHVLVEKPITETADQARRLVDEAAARGLVLMVDHTFCYTSAVQKLRELVAAGELGTIYYYISNRMNLGLFQNDVDVVWDLAVHDIAILQYCLGTRPLTVSACGTSHVDGRPVNIGHVTMFYPGGMVADLNVSWLSPVKIRQSILSGDRRMVVYDDLETSEKIKIYDSGVSVGGVSVGGVSAGNDPDAVQRMLVSYRIGDMTAPRLGTKEALLTEIEHFAACIGDGTVPLTDGMMGLEVVEVLESASLSMASRGHPIDLQRLRRVS
jgi:predicted dehydrogenase